MKSKCTCFNSKTNCFTGGCSICGMSKNSAQNSLVQIEQPPTWEKD